MVLRQRGIWLLHGGPLCASLGLFLDPHTQTGDDLIVVVQYAFKIGQRFDHRLVGRLIDGMDAKFFQLSGNTALLGEIRVKLGSVLACVQLCQQPFPCLLIRRPDFILEHIRPVFTGGRMVIAVQLEEDSKVVFHAFSLHWSQPPFDGARFFVAGGIRVFLHVVYRCRIP